MGFGKCLIDSMLLKAAARIWPTSFHEDMLIEEISELQEKLASLSIKILHCRRGRIDIDLVAEEIADVQICLEQFIECHELYDVVCEVRKGKINRLIERIERENYEIR